jgi:hypothetical protein
MALDGAPAVRIGFARPATASDRADKARPAS